MFLKAVLFVFVFYLLRVECGVQYGPDPWHYEPVDTGRDEPISLKLKSVKKSVQGESPLGDWFYRRLLVIMLKGGQVKENEDNSMDVTISLRLSKERWKLLNDYVSSNNALTEDMYRRSIGYVEEGLYKPTFTERVVMAWSDYVTYYLQIYRMEVIWLTSTLSGILAFVYVSKRISRTIIFILIFIVVYLYESFISYKEAEQQEYNKFMSAMNACQWYFWTSKCDMPLPDPTLFLKQMHPVKITLKIMTMFVAEPLLHISSTVQTITYGITGAMWAPLRPIINVILLVSFNALIIMFLVMILFNFILNIPFKFGFLLGLVSICIPQRDKPVLSEDLHNRTESNQSRIQHNTDRISGDNLNKLLRILSHADQGRSRTNDIPILTDNGESRQSLTYKPLTRSASAGRLVDLTRKTGEIRFDNNKNRNLNRAIDGCGDM